MRPGVVRAPARLVALVAFAIAMGWLEATVVVYIRALIGIPHGPATPEPGDVMERLHSVPWLIRTEQGRELSTLIMLAAVAWIAARSWRARLGALLVCFGVWDVTYYISLHEMLGWPASLATMDVLFLIPPHPLWNQPVWVPVAISCVMIGVGAALFARDGPAQAAGRP